jgi:hypothetical protein
MLRDFLSRPHTELSQRKAGSYRSSSFHLYLIVDHGALAFELMQIPQVNGHVILTIRQNFMLNDTIIDLIAFDKLLSTLPCGEHTFLQCHTNTDSSTASPRSISPLGAHRYIRAMRIDSSPLLRATHSCLLASRRNMRAAALVIPMTSAARASR